MRKNFDKFIIDNVIMERSKLDELFHPVILNEEILKYSESNLQALALQRLILKKGIKIIYSKDELENNYYSSDSYKMLDSNSITKFENIKELFYIYKTNNDIASKNKLNLYYSRVPLYAIWLFSDKTNIDIDKLQEYACKSLECCIDNCNIDKLDNFNLFALEYINKKIKKLISTIEVQVNEDEIDYEMEDLMDQLFDYREKIVLKEHYGLSGNISMSRQSIADKYNVKLKDIIRIEKNALKKLEQNYSEILKGQKRR